MRLSSKDAMLNIDRPPLQGENERLRIKVNGNSYDISSIKRVTKKFLEVSRCSRAKQRQRNVQKKCAARAKLFSLIRPIVVFHRFSGVACLPRLALHDFIFCLNKL